MTTWTGAWDYGVLHHQLGMGRVGVSTSKCQCGRIGNLRGACDMVSWRGSTSSRIVSFLVVLALLCSAARAGSVGVCYGRSGDNLPTPGQSVSILKTLGVTSIRIFDANADVIRAFADSGIDISITVANDDLPGIALSQNTSDQWIISNVLPWIPPTTISSISVGSEVIMSDSGNISTFLVPAMRNIYTSLKTNNLHLQIKVTTSNSMTVLEKSFPPSTGTFNQSILPTVIYPMLQFLSQTRAPFLLNSYPYYAYVGDPNGINLAYAVFGPNNGIVDTNNNLQYTNLMDAQLDAVFAAMSAVNFTDIDVVVAETGWPSKGDSSENAASINNAQTYNQNLINHIVSSSGTPLKPGITIQTYIFSLYNEDLKSGPASERNFGIYGPDGNPVYKLDFLGGSAEDVNQNRTWCVARNDASNASLAIALNYACGVALVDCSAINQGGSCFVPNTYVNHASYAFNEYYQQSNMDPRSCNFSGTATLTQRDPSYGMCDFYARSPSSALSLWVQLHALSHIQVGLALLLCLHLIGV